MNSRNKIILSGAILALVMLVTTNVFFTSGALAVGIGVNETPSSMLSVFVVKKAALICDETYGQVPPAQNPPEIGGCVDVYNPDGTQDETPGVSGNQITAFRFNEYLFTGEQLAELVVARDLSGAEFLASTANMMVDGHSVVTCTKLDDGYAHKLVEGTANWFGHDVSDLLDILPPAMGVTDHTGFHESTDALYSCKSTVETSWLGSPSSVNVLVSDATGATASTVIQKWYFNPAISISISFDSGSSIQFPAAQPGQVVYSTNTLMIKNTAAGGVDLAVYLAGNNLQDTSGIGLCPHSNILEADNIAYRCKVGTYMSEQFTPLQLLNQKLDCQYFSERECLVDGKVKIDEDLIQNQYNDLIPDAASAFTSILYNGHTAECWFQLTVPKPCIGSFSAANAVDVLVRAI